MTQHKKANKLFVGHVGTKKRAIKRFVTLALLMLILLIFAGCGEPYRPLQNPFQIEDVRMISCNIPETEFCSAKGATEFSDSDDLCIVWTEVNRHPENTLSILIFNSQENRMVMVQQESRNYSEFRQCNFIQVGRYAAGEYETVFIVDSRPLNTSLVWHIASSVIAPITSIASSVVTPITSTETPNVPIIAYCLGAPEPRLKVGELANVCTFRFSMRLRNGPGLSYEVINGLAPEEEVYVFDGPICSDGFFWWQIETKSAYIGWVAEGSNNGDSYYLCPK